MKLLPQSRLRRRSRRQLSRSNRVTKFEALENRQLLAADIPDFDGVGQIGEAGTVQVNHQWTTVNLDRTYQNPVVIAGPATQVGSDPVSVRVRQATGNSFQIAVDEWDYLDGSHTTEKVSYLVMEGGRHQLLDGTKIVAGYLNDQDHNWTSFSTDDFFDSQPVVLSQIMTDNESSTATTRMRVLSSNGFEVRIQEEEAADDIHAPETVGFVALETNVGLLGSLSYQVFVTPAAVTHATTAVTFDAEFSADPVFLADMQTYNGADTSTVRSTGWNSDRANFFIEEEQSSDAAIVHNVGEAVGGLAIEAGGIFNDVSLQDELGILEQHIRGDITLSFNELKQWSDQFDIASATLESNINDLESAIGLVNLYESDEGPLFTPQGTQQFTAAWGNTDSFGLERAIFRVYQAVFDAVDANLISNHPGTVDGMFFRSTEYFPGSVPSPTDPNAVYQIRIDGSLAEEFGSPGGYDTNAARRMTGAYLAPGSIAEVIVPAELVGAGYNIRIGGHSWDLSNRPTARRLDRVSNRFQINSTVTQIANPMGGNVYIEVPVGADAGLVDVQFRNTIRAPFFSDRGFDETSKSEWENTERYHPGAFTDVESEHSMWTVPTKWVTSLGYDKLMEIIEAHDANFQVASEYVGKNADRHKASLYMIVDVQIRANAFSIGYPQSNYGNFNRSSIQAPLTLGNALNKVLWHEHGHAEYVTMFAGEAESHVHTLAMAIEMEQEGRTLQQAFARSLAYGPTVHTTSDALNSWVLMDEFLAGQNMAYQQGSYRPRGHGDYAEFVEMFGLEAIKSFNRQINIEMDGLEWSAWPNGRRNHNYNDRILRLSREAGIDVSPLFHVWGHAPSNRANLASAMQLEGLKPSALIYDRLVDARNSVPLNQAQWNSLNSRIGAFLNNASGPWEELNANYDVSRGQAAVARIDELIELYYPDGRPKAVVVREFANYLGASSQFSEGFYRTEELSDSLVGNDGISSIQIPDGFKVVVYQDDNGGGSAQTHSISKSWLGSLNDQISSMLVVSDLASSELDYGDAPSSYATLRANDGARHAPFGPQLGLTRSVENDGAPSVAADSDEDDGVLFGGIAVDSSIAAVNVDLSGANQAKVDAWIDFNRDGVWDESEKIIDDVLVSNSMQTINYDLPTGLTIGDAFARVRISSGGGLSANGFAVDGEVEDYVVNIAKPPTVENIVVNGGDAQRSSLQSLEVTFDQIVDIDSVAGNPFALVHVDSGDLVAVVPVADDASGKTVVSLIFDPSNPHVTSFGSLHDGDYELTINAALVTTSSLQLDGNRDGTPGDAYTMTSVDGLFRKYGDIDGDNSVGLTDFAAFRQTFGKGAGEDGYLDGFNFDGEDNIGLGDFAAFRSNFGS